MQPLRKPALKDVTEGNRVATSGPGGAAERGAAERGAAEGGAEEQGAEEHVRRAGSAEAWALGFSTGIRSYAWVPSDLPRKSRGLALILRPRAMPRLGLDFRRGAGGARFFLGTRARPDFLLGIDWGHRHQSIHHKKSVGQPKFPQRWLHRGRGVLRRTSSMLIDFE